MNRTGISILVGFAVIAVGIFFVLNTTKKHHLELQGAIQKVRVYSAVPESTVVIMDMRLANPSTRLFRLRDVKATLVGADGKEYEGDNVAEVDARQLFQYVPSLGQKYNDTLMIRQEIRAGQSIDRMLGVRFDVPKEVVEKRKAIKLRLEDVDGPVTEVSTK